MIILELAKEAKIPTEEGFYQKEDIVYADEAFITSSGIEILPIAHINGQAVGSNRPGKITELLYNLFRSKTLEI